MKRLITALVFVGLIAMPMATWAEPDFKAVGETLNEIAAVANQMNKLIQHYNMDSIDYGGVILPIPPEAKTKWKQDFLVLKDRLLTLGSQLNNQLKQ